LTNAVSRGKSKYLADASSSENNRRARYYQLTKAGRRQLGTELSEFEKAMNAITHVLESA
jgi:DNA-binding MarR family transcriptional regulator